MPSKRERFDVATDGVLRGRPIHSYLLALAVLVALGGFVAAFYVRTSAIHETEVAIGQAVGFTAKLATMEIQSGLDELSSSVKGVAATDLRNVLTDPEGCSLTFSGSGVFPQAHLDILDPQGTVVCSSNPAAVKRSVGYGREDWFEEAQQGFVVTGPVVDSFDGEPAVAEATPSRSGIVVVGFFDLQALGRGLSARFGGSLDFEFLVLTADGNSILSRSIDPSRWSGAPVAVRWPSHAMTFERADLDGDQRFYGRATVEETGWNVLTGVRRASALAPAERHSRRVTLVIMVGVLLTFAALWIVWIRIARPIRALGEAVRGAASGSTSGSVSVRGPAEVISLGAAFDALLASYGDRERDVGESELRYRDMFKRAVEGIAMTTLEGKILDANPAMATMLGYESPQALMQGVRDAGDLYMHPDERVRIVEALASKQPVELDLTLRHADGHAVLASMHYIPILDDDGAIASIQTRVTDQTQRKQLEKQLAQSQRLESLGQLAGGIAHDFNNLLAVILNYSTFVQEALEAPEKTDALIVARQDVTQISNAAKRAASLTQRLLTFARQEVVRPEVLDPNRIVEEAETLLSRTIGEDVEFSTTLTPDAWPVQIDRGRLEQVIINLAVNARDAMPDGGTLSIETANVIVDDAYATGQPDLKAGRYVRVRVTDTGIGMAPEVVERIFDPFFTTKPLGQATGLGLATVHGIVVQAGGSIHVYSEPEVGTTVSVLLPATDQPVSAEKKEPARALDGHEVVLVVEDEDAIREVMRRILTRHGYEVILAATGADAIAIAEDGSRRFDVVITDVVMPGILGREVTERINQLRPGTRLLYMSGYAAAVLDSRGRLEPGRALVEKPFSETELLTAVREAIDGDGS